MFPMGTPGPAEPTSPRIRIRISFFDQSRENNLEKEPPMLAMCWSATDQTARRLPDAVGEVVDSVDESADLEVWDAEEREA